MMQQGGQFQHYQQRFEEFTSNREVLAASGCALGGLLVIALAIIGGAADVQLLQRSGFSWVAVGFYLLVVPLGYAIWRGNEIAGYVATGLIGLDVALDIIASYSSRGVFPEWLVLLKVIIFAMVVQVVWEAGEEDAPPPMMPGPPGPGSPIAPGPPGHRFPGGPGPRR